jgi:hypothetical protein
MDPIIAFSKDLGVISSILQDDASDILRLMNLKLQFGSLRKAEHCRHILAIDLACQRANKPIRKELLLLHSRLNGNDYNQALMVCKNSLNMNFQEGILQMLSLQYDCIKLSSDATEVLRGYKENYVDALDPSKKLHINLDAAEYQAAAFLLVSKLSKVN